MKEEITGERVVLRKLQTEHIEPLFEAARESFGGEFTRWMPWCHENYSIEESEFFIKTCLMNWENGEEYTFAICEPKTGKFIGLVGLNTFNSAHKFYNVGYWVRVSAQKNGFVSEAAKLLAKAAFEVLEINRLEILVAKDNIPSQKAAEKCGAVREGILRNRLLIHGVSHDAVIYSMVKRDFE